MASSGKDSGPVTTYTQAQLNDAQKTADLLGISLPNLFAAVQVFKSGLRLAGGEPPPVEHITERRDPGTVQARELQTQQGNDSTVIDTLDLDELCPPPSPTNLDTTTAQDQYFATGLDATSESFPSGIIGESDVQGDYSASGLNGASELLNATTLPISPGIINDTSVQGDYPTSGLDGAFEWLDDTRLPILSNFIDDTGVSGDHSEPDLDGAYGLINATRLISSSSFIDDAGIHANYSALGLGATSDLSNIASFPILPDFIDDTVNEMLSGPDPGATRNLALTRRPSPQLPQNHFSTTFESFQEPASAIGTIRQSGRQADGVTPALPRKRKRSRNGDIAADQRARRGAFTDASLRQATAYTRKQGACIRCRLQKIRVSQRSSSAIRASCSNICFDP